MRNIRTFSYVSLRLAFFMFIASASTASATVEVVLHDIPEQECLVENLAQSIRAEYQTFFQGSYYDRSVYDIEANGRPNPHFNSLEIFDKYHSANCVGIGLHLIREFKKYADFRLIPAILPESLRFENSPEYDHAVAIASCSDGYVLLDPTMNISEPIVVKHQEPAELVVNAMERWDFAFSPDRQSLLVQRKFKGQEAAGKESKKSDIFTYRLQEIVNADEAISDVLYLVEDKILVFAFSVPDAPFYTFIYRLAKKQIEFSRHFVDKDSESLFVLPFALFENNPANFINRLKTQSEISHLNISTDLLIERVMQVLGLRNPNKKSRKSPSPRTVDEVADKSKRVKG